MSCNSAASTDQPCCQPTDLLCVSIPCTTTIQILGLTLTLGPVCLRLFSGTGATATNAQVAQTLEAVTTFLGSLGTALAPQI